MALPRISTSVNLRNLTEDIAFIQSFSETANEESCIVEVVTLTTSSMTIDFGTVINPKSVAFAHISGTGSILIGFDGVDYDQEVDAGDLGLVRIRDGDLLETATVQTVADSLGSLDGTYFVVEDVNGETWAIGDGTLASAEDNEVSVTNDLTDATAATVASEFYQAMIADEAFSALFDVAYDADVDDDLITITDKFPGVRTNIADTGTTGFTLTTTQEGAAGRSVYAKASSGEVSAIIAVMPK